MPAFYIGDDLGAIKRISYTKSTGDSEGWSGSVATMLEGNSLGRARAVQKLAVRQQSPDGLLAAVRADGSGSVLKLNNDGKAEEQSAWQENRLKQGQKFVGLSYTSRGVYSCTSNGALRLTQLGADDTVTEPTKAVLPMRLSEWRLAPDEHAFAYAGDEVELSIWDTERTFSSESSPTKPEDDNSAAKKRKRTDQLLPNEIWRAKNLPNDSLDLRQPVRNSAVSFMGQSSSSSQHHVIVGTLFGDVRRYDTRAGRRPVANWKGIGKTGGISVIEDGPTEHQAYVSDRGCNLSALDLRNGKVSFAYKGLAGAVTSLAPTSRLLVSTAEDRFVRLHSTFPPPERAGDQQEQRGEVLDKTFFPVIPTVVVWDGVEETARSDQGTPEADSGSDDDEVWNDMQDVESDDEGISQRKKSKAR